MASITIYSEGHLRGTKKTYTGNVEHVPSGENTCYSIKVNSGEWLVYTQSDFEGTSFRLPGPPTSNGIYPEPGSIRSHPCGNTTDWNDQVRSLRPINQDGITLFDKNDFCGAEKAYTKSNPNVQMDNCCSIIVRGGWWQLFPDGGYNGNYNWWPGELILGPGNYLMPIYAGKPLIIVGSVQKVPCPY